MVEQIMGKFLLIIVAYLYCIIAGISTLVFNYQYCRTHGFWSWLLFGEIVATFKGLFWVFFVW